MRLRLHLKLILLSFASLAHAQSRVVSGTVSDEGGQAMSDVRVLVRGQSASSLTDSVGTYAIDVPDGTPFVYFVKSNFNTLEAPIGSLSNLNVTLTRGIVLDEVVTTGTRVAARTEIAATVPVDVLPVSEAYTLTGQSDLNQFLTYASPDFTANPQVLSGGGDFIDPASLRSLGPDQMLVLVNGKRRHKSAKLNTAGTFGRGTVGTDLNAVPIAAVERVEILRDGAVAQYGADAVAGVINIILKEGTGLAVNAIGGARVTSEIASTSASDSYDGTYGQVGINYGTRLGSRGGFLNLTAQGDVRDASSRVNNYTGGVFSGFNNPDRSTSPGQDITDAELARRGLTRADFVSRVGPAAVRNASVFANVSLPLGARTTLYGFGGVNYRLGETKGRYSLPNAVGTVTALYPNGFLPELNGVVLDQSATVGLRHSFGFWDLDLSHAFGRNAIDYELRNSNNASLGAASPTVFQPGEYAFAQNTTNLELRRFFPGALAGINVAIGAEYRLEDFRATAGEEPSYRDYGAATRVVGPNGDTTLVLDGIGPISTANDALGRQRPGGVQGFTAIRPEDAGFTTRSSVGAYADIEADVTRRFALGLAGRYERFSDVGNALAATLSGRVLLNQDLSLRASASSGYRAPSLHQTAYAATTPGALDGESVRNGTFAQGSAAAQALGIEPLELERSRTYNLGAVARIADGTIGLSLDAFQIEVFDRITLTSPFGASSERRDIAALLKQVNVGQASFFANALDTRTRGLDGRATYYARLKNDAWNLRATFGGSYTATTVERVNTSPPLFGAETGYLSPGNRTLVERAVPSKQIYGTITVRYKNLEVFGRNVFFGFVREPLSEGKLPQNLNGRLVTDLSLAYHLGEVFTLTLGANNLFDQYPEQLSVGNQENGQIVYSRTTQQFGSGGRFVFLRVGLAL